MINHLVQESTVRVVAKTPEAEDVVSIEFAEIDGNPLPPWDAGAHVDVVIDGVHERQYSLCGDPQDRTAWRIGVLREENGRGTSRYLHDTLAVGDVVQLRGPRNNFPLEAASSYLFIAGGIGITPILAMIRSAESAGANWRLVYGGRHRDSMGFLKELTEYGDTVTVHPQNEYGHLDLEALLGTPALDTLVYCCGPEPLLAAVEDRCSTWPSHALKVERFSAKALSEPQQTTAFDVVLDRTGTTLTVPGDRSILDVVREAGVTVLSSCAEGICGSCQTRVLGGVPDHRDSVLDDDERNDGDWMMVCVSRSLTPRIVLDL